MINHNKNLAMIVGNQLIHRELSITSAESLTAGMFQSHLGNVPGISQVFPGGFVTYSNHAKHQLLQIPNQIINRYGVVSEPVAKAMAQNSRKLMKTQIGISFTGAAGPGSLEGHPGGTVWIGISFMKRPVYAKLFRFNKKLGRNLIRLLTVKKGFLLLNDELVHN